MVFIEHSLTRGPRYVEDSYTEVWLYLRLKTQRLKYVKTYDSKILKSLI